MSEIRCDLHNLSSYVQLFKVFEVNVLSSHQLFGMPPNEIFENINYNVT